MSLEIISLVTSIVSIVFGIVSIILGIASIRQSQQAKSFSEHEANKSDKSYRATQELLKEIEHKIEFIDRAVQGEQDRLLNIINKTLDKIGMPSTDFEEIAAEDVVKIWNNEFPLVNQRMNKLEEVVESLPKIHLGTEPPTELKTGDLFIQIEDEREHND